MNWNSTGNKPTFLNLMENYFKKIIDDKLVNPPDKITKALHDNFTNPLWVEWFIKSNQYEAIFYSDNTEHIALFDQQGNLLSFRVNLPLAMLPLSITNQVENHGELMNLILKNTNKYVEYELIVRDSKLIRYQLNFDTEGHLIKKVEL